jgi:hypothetical protein
MIGDLETLWHWLGWNSPLGPFLAGLIVGIPFSVVVWLAA